MDQILGAITGFLLVMVLVEDVFPEALSSWRAADPGGDRFGDREAVTGAGDRCW